MNTIRQIEKIERLHKFIKGNCSGDTRALSERLGVSRRTVQYYLQELRELGAIISYDDMQKTYYYENQFEIKFVFEITVTV